MSQAARLMTVMFSDVTGSARLYERLSDEEAAHAVDRCLKRITRCVEGSRGRTVQINGDELLATFESAEDACLAAIEMQARIADLPPVSGVKLSIRIGLHCGMLTDPAGTSGDASITTAARITGLASRDRIFASSAVVDALPVNLRKTATQLADVGPVAEEGSRFSLYELSALRSVAHEPPPQVTAPSAGPRLFIHYHGTPFVLDHASPPLTLGRDPDSKLLIEDRKASRKHARIEYRPEGFVYIDSSTNGSFVSFDAQTESLLRHDELLLHGQGRICFGSSANDPKSDFFTFEFR